MRKKKNVKQERQISHKKICKSNNNEYISHNKDKYVKCLYPDVKIENSHKNNQVPIIPIIDLTFNIEPNIIDLENEIDPRVIDLDFLSYPLYNFENYSIQSGKQNESNKHQHVKKDIKENLLISKNELSLNLIKNFNDE